MGCKNKYARDVTSTLKKVCNVEVVTNNNKNWQKKKKQT